MQRILSEALASHAGRKVTIAGWIHRRRLLKSVAFLILRDRAGLAQVLVTDPAVRAQLELLGEETVVQITGLVVANAAAPGGAELTEPEITALSEPVTDLPVELHRPTLAATLPTLLDHAAVTLRHPSRTAVFALSAALVRGFRTTLDQAGYTEIFTPKIVGSATESGANVFELDYFGRKAYLAQSPQFYKQTMVGVFERVYEVGPAFRAEPSDTARHLAEFLSLDVELGFIEDQRDVMTVLREVLAGMLASAQGFGFDLPTVPAEIPILHFAEALKIAGADPAELDLAPADERALGEWALREHGSDFLFVEGYPTAKRAFYTHPEPGGSAYSRGFDLLFRGLELVSGAQRLHRHDDYVAAIAARGDAIEPYADFLEVFRRGMPPHGGFAIGLERFVARLVGASNIREVTLFPRDLHRVTP
ncbi:nondiscriminating aspartyl-tRNA synthetase [Allocatelliglobosispora scoriae]|uniref:Aspartate--tRNA(Asp/Asn) ligase n=1 Tax=Allocatelliglobosispora scoriae TaxID=643052 RepID=A0A841BRH0_9ACTN|nr:aspartate--tRNA(Asn) ligase [Allocatelliglobosispora scoriae]MBB5869513.1 nondiscriminating aspartyl-tRNA synthetase [Allocatelliglobosispora scoriae]